MSKKSISKALDDSPPITQADIDSGKLILRQRKQGRLLPLKQRVNIYLDREIIEHFKQRAGGRGYQTLLNEALKQAIQHDRLEDTLIPILNRFSSFPRRRESRQPLNNGIPAFADMTNGVVFDLKKIKPIGKRYKAGDSRRIA